MKLVDTLRAARKKIVRGWTQGVSAYNSKGERVHPKSKTAICWCISGAVMSVPGSKTTAFSLLRELAGGPVTEWNDTPGRTKRQALALFDRAIKAASK